jgi:uncharacterized protein YndB with AHSA1/START domain
MRVSISVITVNAPRAVVWAAVTLPKHVRQWQYDSELTTDWTVGHPIRFSARWPDQIFEQWGTVEEFTVPLRVRYSLFAPRPGLEDRAENYFMMTYELTECDEGTKVSFIHEDPRELDDVVDESDEENPVLLALRVVAEALAHD